MRDPIIFRERGRYFYKGPKHGPGPRQRSASEASTLKCLTVLGKQLLLTGSCPATTIPDPMSHSTGSNEHPCSLFLLVSSVEEKTGGGVIWGGMKGEWGVDGDRWLRYFQACVGVEVFPEAPIQVPALGDLTTALLSQWLGVLLRV